jgi:hypothetical protein
MRASSRKPAGREEQALHDLLGRVDPALPISGSIAMRCVRSRGRSDLVDLRSISLVNRAV